MLQVILAGQSIDREFVRALRAGELPPDVEPTPETISAAYARISRSPDPIPELRAQARRDVPAARSSNRTIVFRMGHHSVAEHVALNFDVLGISRLALEALEDARLCSYTEKSQRYVTFGGEHVTPEEFSGEDRALFERVVADQIACYRRAFEKLHELQRRRHPDKLRTRTGAETVEGWAKEDARYALGLATETQVGFTANARNVEHVIRKLRHQPLAEVRALSRALFDAASAVAPSLVILSDPARFREAFGRDPADAFLRDGRPRLERLAEETMSAPRSSRGADPARGAPLRDGDVALVDATPDPDVAVLAALLHSGSGRPYGECREAARALGDEARRRLVERALEDLSEFDAVPREFEAASFSFEVVLSAACFGQLKRHRMMSLGAQPYDPALGLSVPDAVREAGLEGELRETAERSAEAFAKLRARRPRAAEYALLNAHRRRALAVVNLRELYHVARLRLDRHAQWDIGRTAASMTALARRAAPACAALACGKDEFAARRAAPLPRP
jgi:flavin-dependent thymidylate synthase